MPSIFNRTLLIQSFAVFTLLFSVKAHSDNNIAFLEKDIIHKLASSVYEVVVPKQENPKIQYSKELPFHMLSFQERNEKYHSIGTAFFINDRELMSAAHVFELQDFSLLHDFFIRDAEGKVYKVGKVNKYSSIRDMIVFDLESYPVKFSPLGFSNITEIGDTVFSVGNVQGEGISFRAGQVASFTTESEYGQWKDIRFTSPASPGNSGGPLVNLKGLVTGLIVKKNSSENHNVAVPINEIGNLKDFAELYVRNVSLYTNDEQNIITRDWSHTMKLPATVGKLSKSAQHSLDKFYVKLGSELDRKFADKFFPRGKRFRSYLRNQQFIRQFGVLKTDADFNKWSLINYASKMIPLTEHQNITISKSDISTLHIIIEKPSAVKLSEFLDDPKMIMDNMLKGMPFTREVGAEKVRIKSLGQPEKTDVWTDNLGRKWTSSLWFIPHLDAFVYNHCLPYPKGAICNLDFHDNDELFKGYLGNLKENYDEIAIGYEGDVVDWVEYFSLDQKSLPKALKTTEISLKDEQFKFSHSDYSLIIDEGLIKPESTMHFHYGYSNSVALKEDLLLFEVFPDKGDATNFRVQKYFSPSEFSSDTYKSSWSDIKNKTGVYSGQIVETKGKYFINSVMENTVVEIDAEDGNKFEGIYVVRCIYDSRQNDMEETCGNFAGGVKFN